MLLPHFLKAHQNLLWLTYFLDLVSSAATEEVVLSPITLAVVVGVCGCGKGVTAGVG